jgi:hypothetical protein
MQDSERPLTVLVGLGFPRQLTSARDALEFLVERPFHDRKPVHRAAVAACRGCLSQEIDADTAHGLVEAYARTCGIIIEEPLAGLHVGRGMIAFAKSVGVTDLARSALTWRR